MYNRIEKWVITNAVKFTIYFVFVLLGFVASFIVPFGMLAALLGTKYTMLALCYVSVVGMALSGGVYEIGCRKAWNISIGIYR